MSDQTKTSVEDKTAGKGKKISAKKEKTSPPPAYTESSASHLPTNPVSPKEDVFADTHTATPYSSSEDLLAGDYTATRTHAVPPYQANPYTSSTDSLLATDYADSCLASQTSQRSSTELIPRPSKQKSTWKTIKKHAFEKPMVMNAATASYAGFNKGKKALDLSNANRKGGVKAKSRKEVLHVAYKVGKAVCVGAKEGKKHGGESADAAR
ncbi:hypothetical protein K458DRAFT_409153 [Lentithecium fluviatile CBS 122367]|uniref:Uncharacterized protein n=1 Tax=Lentithecium fluviatile CBS 122367 TaxID=1168545 RepID=A0A6G1IIX9_9PLEO|nr:hypothetical protein K458DRAFT_409153 [Lentithecium fluviatile CBS 122367]